MGIVPEKQVEKIQFFEDHNSPWAANAVAIGTTTTEVTALATKTAAARAALSARAAAQNAAKAATVTLADAVDAMAQAGQDIILKIKAKAATTGNSVYALAEIPPPALPGPVPAPGTPTNFKVEIREDGSLILAWKCPNPTNATGTIYQIARKVGASGEFVILGATGSRSFIDNTLPSNSSPITYRIIATRSTVAGPPGQFTVSFGVGGESGVMVASVVSAPKLAA